jgi:imidazolonepropionase-like amidohydrolase
MNRTRATARGTGFTGAIATLIVVLATTTTLAADDPPVLVIRAARIHTVTGEPIEHGMIVVRAGRIEAVGRELDVPTGARMIDVSDGVVTPGLIDACCSVNEEITLAGWQNAFSEAPTSLWGQLAREYGNRPREDAEPADRDDPSASEPPVMTPSQALASGLSPAVSWAEQASEVTPHRLVIDGVNPLSHDFERLLKSGVTTVYVSPDSADVIGGRGAILKTGGPLPERIVKRADAVKASLGSDPCHRGGGNGGPRGVPTIRTRRPTTRMGVDWVFRKAFYDAERARKGLKISGADTPPTAAVPVLQQVRDGQIPLRIQARMQNDIFTALRLAHEFNLKFVLEEGTEAYRCLPQLKAAGVPVIFGPLYMTPTGFRSYVGEASRARLNTPKQLADAGIEFALTAQELRDEEGLVRQGMVAIQNGLPADHALRAITATPAAMLGLPGKLGVVAPGAVADLVIWSGEPFSATSRPRMVIIGGRVVFAEPGLTN